MAALLRGAPRANTETAPLHALQLLPRADAPRDARKEAGVSDQVWSVEEIVRLIDLNEGALQELIASSPRSYALLALRRDTVK